MRALLASMQRTERPARPCCWPLPAPWLEPTVAGATYCTIHDIQLAALLLGQAAVSWPISVCLCDSAPLLSPSQGAAFKTESPSLCCRMSAQASQCCRLCHSQQSTWHGHHTMKTPPARKCWSPQCNQTHMIKNSSSTLRIRPAWQCRASLTTCALM
jgi:hypothetical protein